MAYIGSYINDLTVNGRSNVSFENAYVNYVQTNKYVKCSGTIFMIFGKSLSQVQCPCDGKLSV